MLTISRLVTVAEYTPVSFPATIFFKLSSTLGLCAGPYTNPFSVYVGSPALVTFPFNVAVPFSMFMSVGAEVVTAAGVAVKSRVISSPYAGLEPSFFAYALM